MNIGVVPNQYSIFFWCIRGMEKARVVLTDENGDVHARTLELPELLQTRDGLNEAISRVTHSMCDRMGHHSVMVDDRCARCGDRLRYEG